MVTVQISVKEFAEAWGVSPRAVQAVLHRGSSYTPIIASKKIGANYILTVSEEWYLNKLEEIEQSKQTTK
jgi:hypothetical protein